MAVAVAEFQLLLVQLAADLDIKLDRLATALDRLDRREALAYVSDAYPELITPYLSAAGDLSATWYEEQPVAAGARPFTVQPAELPALADLAISGRWAMLQSNPVAAAQGAGSKALFDHSRLTVVSNSVREGVRWARHASANACGFCRMLATRGAVYGGEASAKKSHDRCHCLAVPDRDGNYSPAPYVARWQDDYAQARKDGAETPAQIANAMDRAAGGRRARHSGPVAEPAVKSGTDGPRGPVDPPKSGAPGQADAPEPWSGHAKGYVHPHRQPVWVEAERVSRQAALGIVPDGEQLYQHEIETVERLQAGGEVLQWIAKDTKTFLPTNDVRWISRDGILADLKATGPKYATISQLMRKAVEGGRAQGVVKENFVVDIGQATVTAKLRTQLGKYNVRNPDNTIAGLWVVTRGELVQIELGR